MYVRTEYLNIYMISCKIAQMHVILKKVFNLVLCKPKGAANSCVVDSHLVSKTFLIN